MRSATAANARLDRSTHCRKGRHPRFLAIAVSNSPIRKGICLRDLTPGNKRPSSLLEEAITSSQLEGAATTSRVARSMLRSGRKPANRYERMILNNYHGLEYVREIRDRRMSPALLLDLHRVLTEETLEDPEQAGRLRTASDDVVVHAPDGTILHDPPAAETIGHGLRHPDRTYTIRSHRTSHRVVYQTARTDLLHLVELGLMEKEKIKRTFVFRFVSDLERRLRRLGSRGT